MVRTTSFLCPKLAKLNNRDAVKVIPLINDLPSVSVNEEEIHTKFVQDRVMHSKKRKREDDSSRLECDDSDITDSDSEPFCDISFMNDDSTKLTPFKHAPLRLRLSIMSPTASKSFNNSANECSSTSLAFGQLISGAQHVHVWQRSSSTARRAAGCGERLQYRHTCIEPGCRAEKLIYNRCAPVSRIFGTSLGTISDDNPLIDKYYKWKVFGKKLINGYFRVYARCTTVQGCTAKKYYEEFWDVACNKLRFRIFHAGIHEHDERVTFTTAMNDVLYYDELDCSIDYSYLRGATQSSLNIEDISDITLNASRTPCIDCLAFCAVMRLGACEHLGNVTIFDLRKVLDGIKQFCMRRYQTADEESRIKTLKRWFDGIPKRRYRDAGFVMRTKNDKIDLFSQIIKKLQIFCISKGYLRGVSEATQQALYGRETSLGS